MEIKNKTKQPLRVPLPGGKILHLSPGATGQIGPKAKDHPPLKQLIDDQQIEVVDDGRSQGKGGPGVVTGTAASPGGGPPRGGVRHTGDR